MQVLSLTAKGRRSGSGTWKTAPAADVSLEILSSDGKTPNLNNLGDGFSAISLGDVSNAYNHALKIGDYFYIISSVSMCNVANNFANDFAPLNGVSTGTRLTLVKSPIETFCQALADYIANGGAGTNERVTLPGNLPVNAMESIGGSYCEPNLLGLNVPTKTVSQTLGNVTASYVMHRPPAPNVNTNGAPSEAIQKINDPYDGLQMIIDNIRTLADATFEYGFDPSVIDAINSLTFPDPDTSVPLYTHTAVSNGVLDLTFRRSGNIVLSLGGRTVTIPVSYGDDAGVTASETNKYGHVTGVISQGNFYSLPTIEQGMPQNASNALDAKIKNYEKLDSTEITGQVISAMGAIVTTAISAVTSGAALTNPVAKGVVGSLNQNILGNLIPPEFQSTLGYDFFANFFPTAIMPAIRDAAESGTTGGWLANVNCRAYYIYNAPQGDAPADAVTCSRYTATLETLMSIQGSMDPQMSNGNNLTRGCTFDAIGNMPPDVYDAGASFLSAFRVV